LRLLSRFISRSSWVERYSLKPEWMLRHIMVRCIRLNET